jgi:hypothetical protein
MPDEQILALTNSHINMASNSESQADAEILAEAFQKIATNSGQKSNAHWGFLKNIVNIDSFFSSGGDSKKKSSSSAAKKSDVNKTATAQKAQKTVKSAKKSANLSDLDALNAVDADDQEAINSLTKDMKENSENEKKSASQ